MVSWVVGGWHVEASVAASPASAPPSRAEDGACEQRATKTQVPE
jgi:hypothetical protein